jgi:ubiquinone/menaquinone biosynthesis C-methylase UbiE
MKRTKTWGKDIWEEKIRVQKPEFVVGGSLATKEKLIRDTENKILFLEKKVLPLIKEGGKIIDVGIGPLARFSIEFAKRNYQVIGIDVSPTTIKLAKEKIKKIKSNKKIKLLVGDIISMDLKEKADMVFCCATFYHIPSYLSLDLLRRFNRILKKGGYVFVEFGLLDKGYSLKKHLFGLLWYLGHLLKKLRNKDFTVTVTKFTKEEIGDMIKLSGFKIEKVLPGNLYLLKKI